MAGDPFTAETQAAVINGVNVEFTDAAQKRKLTLILNKLKKIPTGQKALADLAEHKTVVSLDNISAWGAFMPKNNRIVLWGSASNTKLFSVLVHEARHMYQHQNGAGQYKRNDLDIQSQIMLDRAKEADAQTAALTACFEWAAAGDQKPFQAFCDKTPIIYNSYFFNRKKQKFKDGTDKAKTAIFKAWYEQDNIMRVYENSYMGKPAMRELADCLEKGRTFGDYTKAGQRQSLTPRQVIEKIGADYMIDPDFLATEKARAVTRPTKEALSLAFETNGRKDPSLEKIPLSDQYVTSMNINPVIEPIVSAHHRCCEKVVKALGVTDKKAFFEKTPAEQRQAAASQPESVRDALRRAQALKAAQDMFACLPELSKENAALKKSKDAAGQKEAAARVAAVEKEMKEHRKTVTDFTWQKISPARAVLKMQTGR